MHAGSTEHQTPRQQLPQLCMLTSMLLRGASTSMPEGQQQWAAAQHTKVSEHINLQASRAEQWAASTNMQDAQLINLHSCTLTSVLDLEG
jgi:hypothetical protein